MDLNPGSTQIGILGLKGPEGRGTAPYNKPYLSPPSFFFIEQDHGPEAGLVSSCLQLPPREIPGLNCPEQPHLGPPQPCPGPHLAQQFHSCAGLQLPTVLPSAPCPGMASYLTAALHDGLDSAIPGCHPGPALLRCCGDRPLAGDAWPCSPNLRDSSSLTPPCVKVLLDFHRS